MSDDRERAEYIRAMGETLGALCYELEDEIYWLRYKWNVLKDLFDNGPERIEILNRTAPNFFYFIKKLIYEDVMLHLSRLTDPPKMGGFENLSARKLATLIPDGIFKESVLEAEKKISASCEFARKWRDKRLAHTDLSVFRNGYGTVLPEVTAENVDKAIDALRGLLALFQEHYHLQPSISLLSDPWGTEALLHCLEKLFHAEPIAGISFSDRKHDKQRNT